MPWFTIPIVGICVLSHIFNQLTGGLNKRNLTAKVVDNLVQCLHRAGGDDLSSQLPGEFWRPQTNLLFRKMHQCCIGLEIRQCEYKLISFVVRHFGHISLAFNDPKNMLATAFSPVSWFPPHTSSVLLPAPITTKANKTKPRHYIYIYIYIYVCVCLLTLASNWQMNYHKMNITYWRFYSIMPQKQRPKLVPNESGVLDLAPCQGHCHMNTAWWWSADDSVFCRRYANVSCRITYH